MSASTDARPPMPGNELLTPFTEIALPQKVGMWPPSWPLALLLLTVLLFCLGLLVFLHRRRKQNRYRRVALTRLQAIITSTQSETSEQRHREVNELLKSCVLKANYPLGMFASKFGVSWYVFLSSTLPKKQQKRWSHIKPMFNHWANASYKATTINKEEMHTYFQFCESWIKHHHIYGEGRHV